MQPVAPLILASDRRGGAAGGLPGALIEKSVAGQPPCRAGTTAAHGHSNTTDGSAEPGPGRSRRAWEAPRNGGLVAARVSALRDLTRRLCLSVVSEANEASWAAGHETEYRRVVGPQGRPPDSRAASGPDPARPPRQSSACAKKRPEARSSVSNGPVAATAT